MKTFIEDDPSTYPEKDSSCLCFDNYMKEYVILQWNSHFECWDDPIAGDTYCHSSCISRYEYMSNIINVPTNN